MNRAIAVLSLVLVLPSSANCEDKPLANQCLDDGGKACTKLLKDCDQKQIADACAGLAFVRFKQNDDESIVYFKKACRLGSKQSCDFMEKYNSTIADINRRKEELSEIQQIQNIYNENSKMQRSREDAFSSNLQNLADSQKTNPKPQKTETHCRSYPKKDINGKTNLITDCD